MSSIGLPYQIERAAHVLDRGRVGVPADADHVEAGRLVVPAAQLTENAARDPADLCACLRPSTDSSGVPRPSRLRERTSTNTTVSPSSAIRSISPARQLEVPSDDAPAERAPRAPPPRPPPPPPRLPPPVHGARPYVAVRAVSTLRRPWTVPVRTRPWPSRAKKSGGWRRCRRGSASSLPKRSGSRPTSDHILEAFSAPAGSRHDGRRCPPRALAEPATPLADDAGHERRRRRRAARERPAPEGRYFRVPKIIE